MCFFFKQTKKAKELENRFKAKIVDMENFSPTAQFNAFEFPKTPVIIDRGTDKIVHLNWGLIPPHAHNDEIKKYTLNARIETLGEKKSFKNVLHKRCLVLADGFYEWQWLDSKGKKKQKYLINLSNNEAFAFAGLWSVWKNSHTQEKIFSYTIVTTAANEIMAKIHNTKQRMPVILNDEWQKAWLKGEDYSYFSKPEVKLVTEKVN